MPPHDDTKGPTPTYMTAHPMTAGALARVIVEDEIDPYDDEAVIHSLVARGRRPDDVHLSIFATAAYLVTRGDSDVGQADAAA